MEKIKHRVIHFSRPRYQRTPLTALLAGALLGVMVVGLCTMLVLIFG